MAPNPQPIAPGSHTLLPDSVSHGTYYLLLIYVVLALPMLAGLIHGRAYWRQFLIWPLGAAFLAAIVWIVWAILTYALGALWHFPATWLELPGFAFLALAGYLAGRSWARAPKDTSHKRGAVVEGRGRGLLDRQKTEISIAGVPVPPEDETKHFKCIGTTGTGKSTAIAELLQGALARGDRAVIADPDGGYIKRFYNPERGDVILNPFDGRSVVWDLFAEIEQPYDVEHLAQALIPGTGGHSDREWKEYGRTFFTAVARQLFDAHDPQFTNVTELCRMLIVERTEELRGLLGNTAAAPFLEESNAKMLSSIRSVASSALKPLEYVQSQQGTPFSIRQWIKAGRSGKAGGVLFLPYTATQIAALSRLISAWMRLAIFETMNTSEGDQRLWFVVDELDALGAIDGLKDALARLRKFGGRCVLGFQSIAQVRASYGYEEAATIVENCGNTLILRCSASEGGGTAGFASQLIGLREVVRTQISKSRRPDQWQSTQTTSDHHITEHAVMPSEIEQIPDLKGFLKLASSPSWKRVQLVPSGARQ
jgi:type IV secretory pathway TraG/TraD family ATPase VirD4